MSTGSIFRGRACSAPVSMLGNQENIATASSADTTSELKVFVECLLLWVMRPPCPMVHMPLGLVSKRFEELLTSTFSVLVSKIKGVR